LDVKEGWVYNSAAEGLHSGIGTKNVLTEKQSLIRHV